MDGSCRAGRKRYFGSNSYASSLFQHRTTFWTMLTTKQVEITNMTVSRKWKSIVKKARHYQRKPSFTKENVDFTKVRKLKCVLVKLNVHRLAALFFLGVACLEPFFLFLLLIAQLYQTENRIKHNFEIHQNEHKK
jgi:hypothetical protein